MSIKEKLEDPKLQSLLQFIKFGLVGVSNTAISYGVEMLCYYVLMTNSTFLGFVSLLNNSGIVVDSESVKIVIVTILAFVVSVTNAYYWNSRYVFKSEGKSTVYQQIWAYLRTVACYAATGLIITPAIKLWLAGLSIPYWAASLSSLVVTIPLNYILNRYWAFRRNRGYEKDE